MMIIQINIYKFNLSLFKIYFSNEVLNLAILKINYFYISNSIKISKINKKKIKIKINFDIIFNYNFIIHQWLIPKNHNLFLS